jgi:predicted N-acetyltransferase YhbS
MTQISVSKAEKSEFPEIAEFYKTRVPAGYKLNENDTFFIAKQDREIIGSVRLVREEGVLVLRAMQVHSEFQRKGIGRLLLDELVKDLGSEDCYCIPYEHLETFYGLIGFKKISIEEAPAFLQERIARYLKDIRSIMMKRPGRHSGIS